MQSSEKMENIITDLDYNVKFSYMGAPRSFPEHWHEFAEFISQLIIMAVTLSETSNTTLTPGISS